METYNEEESKTLSGVFKRKTICKEICDFLNHSNIAKLELINNSFNTSIKSTLLNQFVNVKLISNDF